MSLARMLSLFGDALLPVNATLLLRLPLPLAIQAEGA
jgi:hypothetical protein